jgi:hypothetical protein
LSDALVNSINPTSGNTMMIDDPAVNQLFAGKPRPRWGLRARDVGSRDYCSAGPSSVRYIAATWAYPAEEYFRLSQLLR